MISALVASCLPALTAAQVLWSVSQNAPVQTQNIPRTRAQLAAEVVNGGVDVVVRFDPKFDGVSLPYTVYAVLVIRSGAVQGWWDFTHGCKSPGFSFFPGREVRIPAVKSIGADPEQLQIMVWGRM